MAKQLLYSDKLMKEKEVSLKTHYRDETIKMKARHSGKREDHDRRRRWSDEDDEDTLDRRGKEECPAEYMFVLNEGEATITVCLLYFQPFFILIAVIVH